ncbi:MAG TPA: FAD-linked oxidase C-terminal domain-containing protein [Terriglobales bacterium]|nr:FAD-linked oxidase C-terminal domain-containing protein [Terriglobales bacterium]
MSALHDNPLVRIAPPPATVDFRALEQALRQRTTAEVRFDAGSRALYATDASNYRQVPIGVVVPRSIEDVVATIGLCREFGAPVLSRGGGTSLAGQCCNVAVVLDWSKYLNRVVALDPAARRARVLPGTVLDDLREAAQQHGLTFGPDPATHNHCTLGGMLGNNSCGVHAQMAGKTVDNTEELELLTYDGLRLRAGWMTEADLAAQAAASGRVGEIFRGVARMRERYARLIAERYPKIPRRVSGYNLDSLLPGEDGRFNLARALVGSEGTLVTILEATVHLVPWPKYRTLVVLGYPDVYHAADHIPDILPSRPIGLEGLDSLLVENMKKKRLHEEYLKLLPEGRGWLLVEFGGETQQESDDRARELMDKLKHSSSAPTMKLYDDPEEEKHVWATREAGLGATAFVPGQPVTWEGWEDSAVAPERLGAYLRDLCKLYEKFGYIGALYGHFGMGCVHTRISFDLMSAPGVRKFREFLEEATDLVVAHGGSLSGEHGDGQSRAEFLHKMFGPELVEAFREFKRIWDPEGRMNPGKVVDPYRADENLRLGAAYRPAQPRTYFQFPDDHGRFSDATLRCVGVGECRKERGVEPGRDTMCPSYMVTREEKHSTRGRAHLLWEMLQGDVLREGWRDENVKEALDLCLACKGCKGECPVNVDLATYKAEFLAHYFEGRLRPRHAYAFGFIDQWARLASLWPGAVNLVTQTPLLRDLAKLAAGIPRARAIPEFAPRTFQAWFARHRPRHVGRSRVLLWPDTFNNYFFPETAQAAAAVLDDAGFAVDVPRAHLCCGRPLYDFGMLATAKRYLERVLEQLAPELAAGTPIVVLEPSCASVFRDELRNLLPGDPRAEKLRRQTVLLSEFLARHVAPDRLPRLARKALVQGHCHHKSVLKFDSEQAVLQQLGLDAEVLASGCCGMAGSFGFESDKYDVSIAVGERALLPAVRAADRETFILADGFSCREQIAQQTGRHALHLAEVIQLAKQGAAVEGPPETALIRKRAAARRKARSRAATTLGLLAAGAFVFWRLARK